MKPRRRTRLKEITEVMFPPQATYFAKIKIQQEHFLAWLEKGLPLPQLHSNTFCREHLALAASHERVLWLRAAAWIEGGCLQRELSTGRWPVGKLLCSQ